MLRLIAAADAPARLAPRSGPNLPCAYAAASVWHDPQPCATQTASPPRVCAAGAVAAVATGPGAVSPPDPSPPLVNADRGHGRRCEHEASPQAPSSDPHAAGSGVWGSAPDARRRRSTPSTMTASMSAPAAPHSQPAETPPSSAAGAGGATTGAAAIVTAG